MNKFYKNGKLNDEEIVAALAKAADDYENGEIIEVKDVLIDIVIAITRFEADFEKEMRGEKK